MKYKFKYRKTKSFFKYFKTHIIKGHSYDEKQNKMILFFPDGGIQEIADWEFCECKLGQDWVLAQKESIEKESGQQIPLNIEK